MTNVESIEAQLRLIREHDPTRPRERGAPAEASSTADLLTFARLLADAADRITLRYFEKGAEVRTKADGTLVTAADTMVESLLRQAIAERFPSHAVLGEEEGHTAGSDAEGARWIVDPVDGTHSFARGVPVWATLIACERGGRVEVGVASAPALGTRWWAARGLGAYRAATSGDTGGRRIEVSKRAALGEAQVLFGSYSLLMERWGERAHRLLLDAWRVRGFGDFWGHCLVAEGSAEVMIEPEVSAWDLAATQVIVEEAGGRMTGLDGRADIDAGHAIITNGLLHDEVLRRLRG